MTHPIVDFCREALDFPLWPAQAAILDEIYRDGVRTAFLRLGRRSGKSRLGAAVAVFESTANESVHRAHVPEGEVLSAVVVATSLRQARIVRRYVGSFMRAPALRHLVAAETEDEVRLRNGFTIAAVPCFAASARGATTPVVVFDEAAHFVGRDGSPIDVAELWSALVPGTAGFEQGKVLVLSTPRWSVGWFHEQCERASSGEFPDMVHFHHGTSEMNPRLAAFVERERLKDPSLARREFDAEWDSGIGAVFDDALVRSAVRQRGDLPPAEGVRYAIAVDAAFTGDTFSVLVGHRDGDRIVVDRVAGWRGTRSAPVQVDPTLDEIATLSAAYGRAPVTLDQYSAEPLKQGLRSRGVSVRERPWTNEAKVDAVAAVRQALYAGRLEIPAHRDLVAEMVTLEQRPLPSGRPRIAAPGGRRDDYASALMALVAELAQSEAGGVFLAGVIRDRPASLPTMMARAARARRRLLDRTWVDPRER